MVKKIVFALMAVVLFMSCDKEQDLSDIDIGYKYFPTTTGSFVIYRVDSVWYGLTEETYQYQIKEEIADQFVDAVGQPAMVLNRYYRLNNGQPWTLADVWTSKRTGTTAEKVEENVRYVKLEFPVKENETWNGNAFNSLGAQEYSYTNVAKFADVGILQFDNTITVQQKNNVNLVDEEVFYEIYADGIGMVYKQATDLNKQGNQTSGYSVSYQAIAYSIQ
jgi:uncharacterized lipoprotein NlpE involved in copper resistance